MPEVGVSAEIIKKQIVDLKIAADEIRRTRQAIMSQYQQLGCQWNDSKYRILGGILNESNASLRSIEKIFLQSQKKLCQMLGAVTEYEGINLTGTEESSSIGYEERLLRSAGLEEAYADAVDSTVPSVNSFSGFSTQLAPWNEDMLFIKGNHFGEYIAFRENDSGYDSDNLLERGADYVTGINAADIEGIHISARDAANSDRFWSQHRTGGTFDSFREIASHIPEVKARLSAGECPDEWDGVMSECYGMYFRDPLIVDDYGGYYVFSGNGRHRILAARSFGYDIPVRIACCYSLRH